MDETKFLTELASQSLGKRIRGYAKLSGPGYMQSAMTLGGGSVASCVVMGSMMGYKMLWVQPLAIILGYFVLAAIGKITCQTGDKPYQTFWERLHPGLALAWAISAMVATVLWHIPQYSLTANGIVSLASGIGLDLDSGTARAGIGAAVLLCACAMAYLYHAGARGLRLYEMAIKVMVWGIVVAFAIVAFASGFQWGRFFTGITGIDFARDVMAGTVPDGIIKPVVGGLAAAVGINMLFLYPYSLLQRNWGKLHKELSYFDLMTGMVVPFLVATTFMIIGTANTIGPKDPAEVGTAVQNILDLVPVLAGIFGQGFSLFLIGFGMAAVGFSTITTHMLASGFIGCEMFGLEHKGKAKLWFSLVPAVGVIGVAIKFPWYAAITASTLAAPLMPLAVICFIILLNQKSYMGDGTPKGAAKLLWNVVLILSVVTMIGGSYFSLTKNWQSLMEHMNPKPTEPAAAKPSAPTSVPEEQAKATVGETAAPSGERLQQTFTHEAMGTMFEFTLYTEPGASGTDEIARIAEEAFAAVDDLEQRVSRWVPNSQTSYINNRAAKEPVKVAPDIIELLAFAKEVHKETEGAFDVTVGPLIELWGFYKGEGHLPSQEELSKALANVGLDKVVVDRENRTVAFSQDGIQLDFGGIGKGMALDSAAEVIRGYGVSSAILNAGTSTVVAMGAPPDSSGWTVRVRDPYNDKGYIDEVILKDESLSTSASYEKRFVLAGKEYCHIFDPRTGMPVEGMISATVIAPLGIQSDALSTSFFVMGEEKAEEYCRSNPRVRAILAPTSDGQIRTRRIGFPA